MLPVVAAGRVTRCPDPDPDPRKGTAEGKRRHGLVRSPPDEYWNGKKKKIMNGWISEKMSIEIEIRK